MGKAEKKDEERDPGENVKINRFHLEKECERQPSLYMYESDLLAEAKEDRDFEEDELDRLLGKRELEIRDNPPDGFKVTEGSVKAALANDDLIIAQKKKFRRSKARVARQEGIVKAMEQRKSMLESLTIMWSKGYYSVPEGARLETGTDAAGKSLRTGLNKDKKGEGE
jgi:hypothetical protein